MGSRSLLSSTTPNLRESNRALPIDAVRNLGRPVSELRENTLWPIENRVLLKASDIRVVKATIAGVKIVSFRYLAGANQYSEGHRTRVYMAGRPNAILQNIRNPEADAAAPLR